MYLITAELASTSGLAEDNIVNTFAFTSIAAVSDALALDMCGMVQDFYNAAPGPGLPVCQYLSPALSRTALQCTTRAYFITGAGLAGGPHGSPQVEENFTLGAIFVGDTTPLPAEVALKITFEGSGRSTAPVEGPGDTRPKARRTGGVYIGPFHEGVLDGTEISRPAAGTQDDLREAARRLFDASDAVARPLSVWSRADASLYPLEAVSTDNAWDTQRRRGEKGTVRTRELV